MAISKNNPAVRDNHRLLVQCPKCDGELTLVKRIPGGMQYVCYKDGTSLPVTRGSYKNHKHEWVRK
jgi:hypothetical protein